MTDYDPEIFTNNPDVMVGDGGILFKTGNSGIEYLGKGDPIRVGDKIVINHTNDGDLVTHGRSRIKVGDKVIVVKGNDGDLYALKAGLGNPYRDCPLIHHWTADKSQQHDPIDDTYQYHAYDLYLERPLLKVDGGWPQVHVRMDFDVQYELGNPNLPQWYPHGDVWVGVSETGEDGDWWWYGANNPYMTIRGPGQWYCGDGAQWCIQNFMNWIAPPGGITEINYIHVHISGNSSLYFKNYTSTRLLYLTICEGELREGFCSSLDDLGIRSQL